MQGYFEFFCPVRVIAGHDALEKIPRALAHLKAHHPMIVTDKGVTGVGLLDIVTEAIKGGVRIGAIVDEVPPDSDVRVVNQIARIFREEGCDSLIAVGGGSVMDTAKGVNILVSEGVNDLMKFAGAHALRRPLKPLIAIPTTAGTGSEVTLVAVVKDHEKHLKMSFVSHFLLPDVSILDSRMTLSLPPALTAATGMDALSHAVEAYTCLAKNPLSDSHAIAAIQLISTYLLRVTENPRDGEGRLAMATAATLAGIAFSNSMVGMVHALGHSVGSVCGVPHGICMAILLPYGLEYNMHKNGHFTAELLLPLAGAEVYSMAPKEERANMVVSHIRRLNQNLHTATGNKHPRFFREVVNRDGKQMVPWESLREIAKVSLNDGSLVYNPEEMDYEDALMVLEAAWKGEPLDRSRVKKGW